MVKVGSGFLLAMLIDSFGLARAKKFVYKKMNWPQESCGCDARESWFNRFQVPIPQFIFNRLVIFEMKRTIDFSILPESHGKNRNSISYAKKVVDIEVPGGLEDHEVINFTIGHNDPSVQFIVDSPRELHLVQIMGLAAKMKGSPTL